MDSASEKAETRKFFLNLLSKLTTDEKKRESECLCQILRETWADAGSLVFLAFMPLRTEPNLLPFLSEALTRGAQVALPKIEDREIAFHVVSSLDRTWEKHRWGIDEPSPSDPLWSPANVSHRAARSTIVLVPGLAFAADGSRLGRGGGFYDRFLPLLPNGALKVGVGFSLQSAPRLPIEAHDVALDGWFSPAGWHPASVREFI